MIGKAFVVLSAVSYGTIAVRAVQTYQHWRKEKETLSHYNSTFYTYIEEFHYKKTRSQIETNPQISPQL